MVVVVSLLRSGRMIASCFAGAHSTCCFLDDAPFAANVKEYILDNARNISLTMAGLSLWPREKILDDVVR